jgi:uncharacterized protein YeaO (DUF488 family)
MLSIKRVYAPPSPEDGTRFLVDRVWPRGIKKEALVMNGWLPEVAPSRELRLWFGHAPDKWPEFQQRYWQELNAHPDTWAVLVQTAQQGTLTLLYSARDSQHNNALALKSFLEEKLKSAGLY